MWSFLRKWSKRAEAPVASPTPTASGEPPTQELLLEVLRTVDDPELGIDIVNLGLVRAVEVDERGLHVTMTLTSPACPMASWLESQVASALEQGFPEHGPATVEVQTHPPWSPDDMSPAAREQLGITR